MNREPTTGELAIMLENIIKKIDDFHKDQKKEQEVMIEDIKKNTEFRIQSKAVISLIKWLGAGQILTMLYLAMQFLSK